MGERIKVTGQEKLTLLYERFKDVCLVEKEVWKEIFMPREGALCAGHIASGSSGALQVDPDRRHATVDSVLVAVLDCESEGEGRCIGVESQFSRTKSVNEIRDGT